MAEKKEDLKKKLLEFVGTKDDNFQVIVTESTPTRNTILLSVLDDLKEQFGEYKATFLVLADGTFTMEFD